MVRVDEISFEKARPNCYIVENMGECQNPERIIFDREAFNEHNLIHYQLEKGSKTQPYQLLQCLARTPNYVLILGISTFVATSSGC